MAKLNVLLSGVVALVVSAGAAIAQPMPEPPGPAGGKENANPCRDEVAAALAKLRKSSWFRMTTNMITENGPQAMSIDYVLPDKMHQKVTDQLTQKITELILVGDAAWSNDGAGWHVVPTAITQQLRAQMQESVVDQQADVGNYSCKGRTQLDGKDVMAYKLEDEPAKDSTAPKNQAYRMFFVDPTTGLPVGNAMLAPGRENTPLFKATYSFPLDMKIEPPKDVIGDAPPAAGGEAQK